MRNLQSRNRTKQRYRYNALHHCTSSQRQSASARPVRRMSQVYCLPQRYSLFCRRWHPYNNRWNWGSASGAVRADSGFLSVDWSEEFRNRFRSSWNDIPRA